MKDVLSLCCKDVVPGCPARGSRCNLSLSLSLSLSHSLSPRCNHTPFRSQALGGSLAGATKWLPKWLGCEPRLLVTRLVSLPPSLPPHLPCVSASLERSQCKATGKREFKLPWREAGPLNHHDDLVDSEPSAGTLSRRAPIQTTASLGFTDYSEVDKLGLLYNSINFGEGESLGLPNW